MTGLHLIFRRWKACVADGDLSAFPERDSLCLQAVALDPDGGLFVADACHGFLVRVFPVPVE